MEWKRRVRMKVRRILWGAALMAGLGGCRSPELGIAPTHDLAVPVPGLRFAPKTYACLKTPDPITIDGVLDEPIWARVPWSDPFVDIEGSLRPEPRHRTRVKMCWDAICLYLAAELEEPDLWATLTERDAIIFHDNDFEVFIDPDADHHLYTELEINALNTVWDLLLVRPYRDGGPALHQWNLAGLRTAVSRQGTLNDPSDTDQGWRVEIAIPFAALRETTSAQLPPRRGDRWKINFSRVQWDLDKDPQNKHGYTKRHDPITGKPRPEHNWVWSPQGLIGMHLPERWGIVQFYGTGELPDGRPEITDEDLVDEALTQAFYRLRNQQAAGQPLALDPAPSLPAGWSPLRIDSCGYAFTIQTDHATQRRTINHEGRLQWSPRP